MTVTHWIYPTNARSDYQLGTQDGAGEVSPQRLLDSIEQTPNEAYSWHLSTGFRTMRPGDAVWIYAADPYQHICALAQVVAVYPEGDDWYADLLWHLEATRTLMAQPIPRSMFGQVAQRAAVRAEATTAAVLKTWLHTQRYAVPDLEGADSSASPQDTRLRTLVAIVQRRGQARFRQRLFEAYDGRCAMTGEPTREVLEAAHINPYRGEHTNVVTNGLLLRSDLHTLFDLHLIGVDNHGNIVVSSTLDGTVYADLQGCRLALPLRTGQQPSKRSLAAHLNQLV